MILIADSGSTKTTWMEVESGNKVVTEGLNPHFTTDEQFLAACAAVRHHFSLLTSHFSLYFYGAGCGKEAQRQRVKAMLSEAFSTADVHVETDMLGACRAVCGHEAGLVGILGTGSNACYYDGRDIALQPFSTGYILGDQGSANHVGRKLLQDYLSGIMPQDLSTMFHDTYHQSHAEFMDAVYHQTNANRFLASLAPFALEHFDHDYCLSVVYGSLSDWYKYQLEALVQQSGCRSLSLVGSFAAHLGRPLQQLVKDQHLDLCTIVADPIEGLRRFH